jgi:hypothetical protein
MVRTAKLVSSVRCHMAGSPPKIEDPVVIREVLRLFGLINTKGSRSGTSGARTLAHTSLLRCDAH